MLCSAMFVILMTTDRYFKIVHPFLYQRVCSVDLVPTIITASVFFFSYLVGFLPWMGAGVNQVDANWTQCNYLQVRFHFKAKLVCVRMCVLSLIHI